MDTAQCPHSTKANIQHSGRCLYVAAIPGIVRTFPDWHVVIEKLVAEGDWVVEWTKDSGTHQAPQRHHIMATFVASSRQAGFAMVLDPAPICSSSINCAGSFRTLAASEIHL